MSKVQFKTFLINRYRRFVKIFQFYQIPKEKRKQKKGKRIAAAGILILLILFGKRYFLSAREPQEKICKQEITKKEEIGGKTTGKSAKEKAKEESKEEAYLEVALSYFLDMQEYEKCLSYLEKVETKDEMAEAMRWWYAGLRERNRRMA